MKKQEIRKEKGITLVALVVTIIVLIILAGVTLNIVLDQNGIINKIQQAKEETKKSEIQDEIALALSSVQIQHAGDLEEVASEELQNELGEQYIVYPAEKFEVYNKKYNYLYKITSDNSIEFIGEYSIQTTTKTGNSNTPVILSEKGVEDVKLEYSEGQNISILGVNRLNINKANFLMNVQRDLQTITKENNGIKIHSEQLETILGNGYAYYDYIAELDGKLWLSCEASASNVSDIGMRIELNGEMQQLCRGEGKLAESVNVKKGDRVRLIFYSHISSSESNTLYYKNIMLQYEILTSYQEYSEDIKSVSNKVRTIVLDESVSKDDFESVTTSTSGKYRLKYKALSVTDAADKVLPDSSEQIADITVEGIDLISSTDTYNNQIGLAILPTGEIMLYLGDDWNRDTIEEYLTLNPITIQYQNNETEFIGIDSTDSVTTGYIITSDEQFTVSYSYLVKNEEKKTSLVCFGDSITGIFTNETDYPYMITNSSNIKAYNVGFAGCRWTDHTSANYMPFSMNRLVDSICSGDFSLQESTASNCGDIYVERLNTLKNIDFTKVDYVTIFYGTNDWGSNSILKSEDDLNTSEKQRTNVEDAMKYSVSKLKEKYPNLEIIIITPYWRYLNNNDSDTVPNSNGDYLHDYSNYMENIAYNDCKVQTINFYNELDINISNYLEYLPDGTHPNEKLKHIIATYIINKINNSN